MTGLPDDRRTEKVSQQEAYLLYKSVGGGRLGGRRVTQSKPY